MPVTNFHTVNGRIIGETTGSTRTDYLTDALGCVTATVNASQNIINSYRYKPYGELLSKTGTGADPLFMWNGSTGSRRTALDYAEQYNRARHYGTRQAQWTSVDPLWPNQQRHLYCAAGPVTHVDPSGMLPVRIFMNSFIHKIEDDTRGVRVAGFPGVWLEAPWNPFGLEFIKGDGRVHFQKGTSRIRTTISFESCEIGQLTSPLMFKFDPASDPTFALFRRGGTLRMERYTSVNSKRIGHLFNSCDPRTGTGYTSFIAEVWGRNPALPVSPSIHQRIQIRAIRDEDGSVILTIWRGVHTRYPWFELMLQVGSLRKVYKYDARVGDLPAGLLHYVVFDVPRETWPGHTCLCPCR